LAHARLQLHTISIFPDPAMEKREHKLKKEPNQSDQNQQECIKRHS